MKQLPLAIGRRPAARVSTPCWPGANVRRCAPHAGPGAAPVLPVGCRGSGKTHLLRALVARRSRGAGGWFDADAPLPWDARRPGAWSCGRRLRGARRRAPARRLRAVRRARHPGRRGPPAACRRWTCPARRPAHPPGLGPGVRLQPLAEAGRAPRCAARPTGAASSLSDEVMDYLLTRFERDLAPDGLLDPAGRPLCAGQPSAPSPCPAQA